MKKTLILAPVVVALLALLLASAYSQEDMEQVDNSVFENPQRPPAVFRHDEHNEKAAIDACNVCHHVYEDGQLLEDESSEGELCADCHGFEDDGSQPGLEKAYHLNCKGCHRQAGQGPLTCGECHVRP
jgi:hypothetical protein